MAEWLFDRNGRASAILDGDMVRNDRGEVRLWIYGNNLYSLNGKHIGWFESGVLYDSANRSIGFTAGATGYLPSRPGLSGLPGMPGFSGVPGRPGFSGVPVRPGFGGWSAVTSPSISSSRPPGHIGPAIGASLVKFLTALLWGIGVVAWSLWHDAGRC